MKSKIAVTLAAAGALALACPTGTLAGAVVGADEVPPPSSRPFLFPAPVGGAVLLKADDGHFGTELWRSDGTPRGTFLLADLCPGSCDHLLLTPRNAGPDLAFIFADGEASHGDGWRLWRSDGTARGTFPVAEGTRIVAFAEDNLPVWLPEAQRFFFFADPPATGPEPWLSDGTVEGTAPVDLRPGPEGSYPYTIRKGRGRAFFAANDGVHGYEPWVTDGSVEGTRMLVDLWPGERGSRPGIFWDLGDRILLTGSRGGVGRGLWVLDGTGGEPELLQILPFEVVHAGGDGQRLYFLHLDALWVSDGSADGTVMLLGGAVAQHGLFYDYTIPLAGGRMVFDNFESDYGSEPWITDGTPEGTRLLADLCTGVCSSRGRSSGGDFHAHGGRAFFFADDGTHGWEPWVTDGTPVGTVRLGDACPGPCDGVPRRGEAFFTAGDEVYFLAGPDRERRLWRSDGTEGGTGPVTTGIHNGLRGVTPAPTPGQYLLSMSDPLWGEELWVTDGTDAGTTLVRDIAEPPGAGAGGPPYPCVADSETLCLGDGRFRVRVEWRDPRSGTEGRAGARRFGDSDRTGVFWFFRPENVELIVKQLDGTGLNGFHWIFYGALTDVEYWLEVTDLASGAQRTFHNPPGEICGRAETTAFQPAPQPAPVTAGKVEPATRSEPAPSELGLLGGRFRVSVAWRDPRSGDTGVGTAVPGTERTGYFWFFRDDNVELVVKVLDGRPVNGRFWVFYGALTDVEYELSVTDTATATTARFRNPAGEVCGGADTAAF